MNWKPVLDQANAAARWVLLALARVYWFVVGLAMCLALAVQIPPAPWTDVQWGALAVTVSIIGLVFREAFDPRKP